MPWRWNGDGVGVLLDGQAAKDTHSFFSPQRQLSMEQGVPPDPDMSIPSGAALVGKPQLEKLEFST